jgi:hypothetical protein
MDSMIAAAARALAGGDALGALKLVALRDDAPALALRGIAMLASIPAPGQGRDSGLAWAEGALWVGQYRDRKILKIDPSTGAVLRTIESNRFVTGVSFVDGELWHGTWEGDESELRHIDAESGAVLERLAMPPGKNISGLESDGAGLFYAGGGPTGQVRAVRRPPKRASR